MWGMLIWFGDSCGFSWDTKPAIYGDIVGANNFKLGGFVNLFSTWGSQNHPKTVLSIGKPLVLGVPQFKNIAHTNAEREAQLKRYRTWSTQIVVASHTWDVLRISLVNLRSMFCWFCWEDLVTGNQTSQAWPRPSGIIWYPILGFIPLLKSPRNWWCSFLKSVLPTWDTHWIVLYRAFLFQESQDKIRLAQFSFAIRVPNWQKRLEASTIEIHMCHG